MNLKKEYTDPSKPGAFAGFEGFYKALKKRNFKVTKSKILKFLQNQETYTLHRRKINNFPRKRVIVNGLNDTWQLDLVDMSKMSGQNNGYTFLLTAIDVLGKQAKAEKLKNKNQHTVTKAFEKMLKGVKPRKIQVDNGKEFYNSVFEKLLKENNIKMCSTDSDLKASVVERFNRTLKEKMWRYFTEKQTNKWIDIIDDLIDSYNNTYHSSIKIEPINVNLENEDKIYENLYGFKKNEGDSSFLKKFKFSFGDFVRLSKIKKTFEKGYTRNFTREVFQVDKIKATNPVSYNLVDMKSEKLIGSFYEQELQKVENKQRAFVIDKILKTKISKNKKLYFVSWKDYSSENNSWVSEEHLKLIK
jgi:hypothetical protein